MQWYEENMIFISIASPVLSSQFNYANMDGVKCYYLFQLDKPANVDVMERKFLLSEKVMVTCGIIYRVSGTERFFLVKKKEKEVS